MTLVIMAAGMGSRFGGLKQIEPVGPNGEFIIDYSIYDAIVSGFNEVIFIIKEENYDVFRDTIGKRLESKVSVKYAFQNPYIDYNGKHYERNKPYGTSLAIYSVKDMITDNFLVINSDDFYGRDAFVKAYEFLNNNKENNVFGMVGYKVGNTLTLNGSVKRGVCEINNGLLTDIIESKVEKIDGVINAEPLNGDDKFEVSDDTLVSMNVLLFTPYIFELIEKYFSKFIDELENDLEKAEYLIPDVIKYAINDKLIDVKVVDTSAVWHGITYKEDKEELVNSINELIEEDEYKSNLWEN